MKMSNDNKDYLKLSVELPARALEQATATGQRVVAMLPSTWKPINPKNLADVLFRKDKRKEVFLGLSLNKRIELLHSVTKPVQKDILCHIPDADLVEILEAIDPDEATDMLQMIGAKKRERSLQFLSQNAKDSLSVLLEFDPDTAAGLMTLDYILVDTSLKMSDVAEKFKQHEKRTGRPPVIIAVQDSQLMGFLPGHALGLARQSERISKYIERIPSISYAATHDEVERLFQRHPHGKVVVLNDAGNIMGIIYSDDILKLIQDKTSSSLYDFAGISQSESVTDSVRRKVENRYRWLIINLGTAFLAAFTVGLFEDTLSKYVLLAIYMPIVAGMGGNAATQTLAVQVRGIALGQIELKTAWKTLRNELGAGFINGTIVGLLVALIISVFTHDLMIAFILGLAMIINLLVASFFGTLIPLIMQKLGKDPATSATIFITTATDVLGFMAFLGLATLLLS